MEKDKNLSKWIVGEDELSEKTEGKETLERIKHYSAQLEAPDFNESKVFESIRNARTKKKWTSKRNVVLKIAAVFILAVGSLAFLALSNNSTVETNYAQSATIALPDHSEVMLMPGSELDYNEITWSLHRKVNLTGEAFFKVAKGKVFTVATALGEVEILGTQFTVKATDGIFSVTCYEGRVKVSANGVTEVISANEYFSSKNQSTYKTYKINLGPTPVEVDYYKIVNQKFEDVIKDIERYYNIKIEAKNPPTTKNFTGNIPKENMEKALEIVAKTFKLAYKPVSKNSFIFVEDAAK